MGYMVRLGLWGPNTTFPEFKDFYEAVENRGVGAMEMVAIEMKLRGVYMARQLSFEGVEFKTEKVALSNKFIELYNECVDLWVEAKIRFERALDLMEDDNHVKKTVWGQFWGSHQRFFKYLCIAAKVKQAVSLAREALKSDKCVVIGLQSTGEAKTMEQLEESGGELNDFVSTAKYVVFCAHGLGSCFNYSFSDHQGRFPVAHREAFSSAKPCENDASARPSSLAT